MGRKGACPGDGFDRSLALLRLQAQAFRSNTQRYSVFEPLLTLYQEWFLRNIEVSILISSGSLEAAYGYLYAEHSHEAAPDIELVKHLKGIIKMISEPTTTIKIEEFWKILRNGERPGSIFEQIGAVHNFARYQDWDDVLKSD